jgi:GNAT superfamily N-acetyltransferase
MTARTSTPVRIRPLRAGEDGPVDAVFDGLSPHSRYLRFHAGLPRLTAALRASLVAVDGSRRVALVAESTVGGEPVGIARFVATGSDRAELAVAVVDAWQGCGVGRRLLEELRRAALDLGYRELTALVLPENRTMVTLLRRVFPGTVAAVDGGALELICPVDPAAVEITLADLLGERTAC